VVSPDPSNRKARFDEAFELVKEGHFERAEARCREMLQRYPRDVSLLGLLGAVLVKLRRYAEAEQALRRSIELAPTFAKPHEDLGFVLLEQNRAGDAVDVLRTAVRLDPDLEWAQFNLGKALARTGQGEAADAAFEASFALNPERHKVAQAAEHHRAGRIEEAERLYREVIRDNPANVDAIRMLGRVALAAGRQDDAERLFRKALSLAPDFSGALVDLGRVLKEQNFFEDAIECFERVVTLEPASPQGHFLLAGTLAPSARTLDAIAAYQRALELNPRFPGAWLGLGHVLKTAGRQDEAIAAYRKCIEVRPDNGESYWSLANLKTYRLGDDDIAAMKSSLQRTDLNEQSAVNFRFALAKAYEDRQEYDTAWQYYREGNAQQRMQEKYDPVQTEDLNEAIREVFTRDLLAEKSTGGCRDSAPVFVLGLPRSGSTLIEQILASHSCVEGTSELPYLGRVATSLNRNRADGVNYPHAVRELSGDHFAALGEDYLRFAALHRHERQPYFIDKMPNNFPNIGFIHLVLPEATIIDARRHPLDSCLSCFRQLFARGQTFTYDLADIGEYYLEYQRMMDYWHEVLPGKVLTVQYEELVNDFEVQVKRLLAHCRLPWEDACLTFYETDRPVRTASSEQVRRPIYKDSIGFWRHYESQLGELIEVLEPVLPRYRALLP